MALVCGGGYDTGQQQRVEAEAICTQTVSCRGHAGHYGDTLGRGYTT